MSIEYVAIPNHLIQQTPKFAYFHNCESKIIHTYRLYYLINHCIINHNEAYNVSLDSTLLQKNLGKTYPAYIDYLTKQGFLEFYADYMKNKQARVYKVHYDPSLKVIRSKTKGDLAEEIIDDPSFIFNSDPLNCTFIPNEIASNLKKSFKYFKLDVKSANKLLSEYNTSNPEELHKYLWCKKSILAIQDKNFRFKLDNYGRCHTNFTNLKKSIRNNCLTIKGNPITEVDIKSSHPYILQCLMKYLNVEVTPNIKKFYDSFNMDFYNSFGFKERNFAKKVSFIVLNGKNNENVFVEDIGKFNTMFKERYPDVYEFIKTFKKNHKFKLWQLIQAIESEILFNNIIVRIYKEIGVIPIITIHDSIICENIYADKVKEIFAQEIDENKVIKLFKIGKIYKI